jgi:hypothetical protein
LSRLDFWRNLEAPRHAALFTAVRIVLGAKILMAPKLSPKGSAFLVEEQEIRPFVRRFTVSSLPQVDWLP